MIRILLTSAESGRRLSNDRAGAGLGCAFEGEVRQDFDAGRLVPLLDAWWPSFAGIHLDPPTRAQVPRKLRAFTDFFRERLAVMPVRGR